MTQFNNKNRINALSELKISETNGTYIHPDSIAELDVVEFLLNNNLIDITLDANTLTQKTFFRILEKTDGITYRLTQEAVFPDDFLGDSQDSKNISITLSGKGRDQKITIQSNVLEGAVRNIPHARVETLRSL